MKLLTIVAQRVIEHSTVDNKRTITKPVDQGLSISRMSVLLTRISGVPYVLVRQSSQHLYKLKVHEFCHRFKDKNFLGAANKTTLMSFLNGPMKPPSAWMDCIEADSKALTPLVSRRDLQYYQTESNTTSPFPSFYPRPGNY